MTELVLGSGGMRFTATSAGEGPLVLCLHGFPDHRRSWRHQLPALAAAGYHAVAPQLRGYEPQSLPADGDYHLAALAQDVLRWMDELGAERAHLVGHDWGAAIGYVVAALAPERLYSLTTLAVPHFRRMPAGLARTPLQLRNSWYMGFFQLRGLADRRVAADDFAFLERLWRDWSPGWQVPAEELDAMKATFRAPGVLAGTLGYYRAAFDVLSPAGRRALTLLAAPLRVPVMALAGADDGCMDSRLWERVMRAGDFRAGLKVARVGGAGHFLHQEKPAEINALLLDWLGTYAAPGTGTF